MSTAAGKSNIGVQSATSLPRSIGISTSEISTSTGAAFTSNTTRPRAGEARPTSVTTTTISRFRPGYGSLLIGPDTFYYYPALPPGCQTVVVNGQAYYFCNGLYYMPYLYGGTTVFVVVPPPVP